METNRPKNNRKMLYCEPCGFKKIIEPHQEPSAMVEIPRVNVQRGIPNLDPETRQTNVAKAPLKDAKMCEELEAKAKRDNSITWSDGIYLYATPGVRKNRMYKCPKCGRGVVLRELVTAYVSAFDQLDRRREQERIEKEKVKRIEDGKPHEKGPPPVGPTFLG
jgi:predicted RNA-binding Zn-ribbon protein involved in translation (DUF1610 family)